MIAQGVPEFIGKTPPKLAVGDTMPMVGPYGDFNNYQGLRSLYGYRAQSGDPADKAAYNLIQDTFDNAAQRSLAAQGADPNTMKAVQQAYAELVLHLRDVLADRGLRHTQPARGGGKAARLRGPHEHFHCHQVHRFVEMSKTVLFPIGHQVHEPTAKVVVELLQGFEKRG